MPEDRTQSTLDMGIYARDMPGRWVTGVEVAALCLTLLWVACILWVIRGGAPAGAVDGLATTTAVVLPVALIWVVAAGLRVARGLQAETMRLQGAVNALRMAAIERQQGAALDIKPEFLMQLEDLVAAAQNPATAAPVPFASLRAGGASRDRADPATVEAHEDPSQPGLALSSPPEGAPISVTEFIRAMDFPESEHDTVGFRALRHALEDRGSERLIRASQDVLTLLSQSGIYMDDHAPDRARPEIWRRFAQGERGRVIAALGGIHDRKALRRTADRMRTDPVFRDAAHHFLRQFDRTFMVFERSADDADIVALTNTRTARAFMLLGRVAGTFD